LPGAEVMMRFNLKRAHLFEAATSKAVPFAIDVIR
jgi:hypothetical protein